VRVRKLVTGLVLLLGLALLVDFGSAAYAEYRVSRELRTQLKLTADPSVRANGFPFLTQAAVGDYSAVDVRAEGVGVPRLGEVTVEGTLRGVRLPPSQVVSGTITDVVADSVDARVRVGATTLGRFLGIPDLEVSTPPRKDGTPAPAGQSQVVLTGTVQLLGIARKVSIDAGLSLKGGVVQIIATGLDLGASSGSSALAESVVNALLSRLSVTVAPAALPFGLLPTAVRVEGSEIVVAGTGTDVVIVGPGTRTAGR